jgi:hypothetical protein
MHSSSLIVPPPSLSQIINSTRLNSRVGSRPCSRFQKEHLFIVRRGQQGEQGPNPTAAPWGCSIQQLCEGLRAQTRAGLDETRAGVWGETTYRAILSTADVQLHKVLPIYPPVGVLIHLPDDVLDFRQTILGGFPRFVLQLLPSASARRGPGEVG